MLAVRRSVVVAPEVDLRIHYMQARKNASEGPYSSWFLNPEQTSPAVHNRGIRGPTKGVMSRENVHKRKKKRPVKQIWRCLEKY